MQDRPSLAEIAGALDRYLAEDLAPLLPSPLADRARAAAASAARLTDVDVPEPVLAPVAAEIAATVRETLADVPADARFGARIALHLAGMIERELAAGPAQIADEARRLRALGLAADAPGPVAGPPSVAETPGSDHGPETVRRLQRDTAAAIRSGAADARLPEVIEALRAGLHARLRIARPGWEEPIGADLD